MVLYMYMCFFSLLLVIFWFVLVITLLISGPLNKLQDVITDKLTSGVPLLLSLSLSHTTTTLFQSHLVRPLQLVLSQRFHACAKYHQDRIDASYMYVRVQVMNPVDHMSTQSNWQGGCLEAPPTLVGYVQNLKALWMQHPYMYMFSGCGLGLNAMMHDMTCTCTLNATDANGTTKNI